MLANIGSVYHADGLRGGRFLVPGRGRQADHRPGAGRGQAEYRVVVEPELRRGHDAGAVQLGVPACPAGCVAGHGAGRPRQRGQRLRPVAVAADRPAPVLQQDRRLGRSAPVQHADGHRLLQGARECHQGRRQPGPVHAEPFQPFRSAHPAREIEFAVRPVQHRMGHGAADAHRDRPALRQDDGRIGRRRQRAGEDQLGRTERTADRVRAGREGNAARRLPQRAADVRLGIRPAPTSPAAIRASRPSRRRTSTCRPSGTTRSRAWCRWACTTRT